MYDELHFMLQFQLAREAEISKQEVKELKQKVKFLYSEILAEKPINDNANHIEVTGSTDVCD